MNPIESRSCLGCQSFESARKKRKIVFDPPTKYDFQLIFDMRPTTGQAEALAQKAISKNIPTEIIPIYDLKTVQEKFHLIKLLTHRSRVYIIAHGQAGTDRVEGESLIGRITAKYTSFAKLFSDEAPDLKKRPVDHRRITISLVVCYGATRLTNGKESYAFKLSNALCVVGIEARIIARHGISSTYIIGDSVRKTVNRKHHENGTKFSFVTTQIGYTEVTPIKYY